MKFYRDLLKNHGHDVFTPTSFDSHLLPEGLEIQKLARPIHFNKIKNLKDGDCVLVVNPNSRIGYGTFAEIAFAYTQRELYSRRIRILTTEEITEDNPGYEELAVFGIELFNPEEFGIREDDFR